MSQIQSQLKVLNTSLSVYEQLTVCNDIIYGSTNPGPNDNGTIFMLNRSPYSTPITIYTFTNVHNGSHPNGSLVLNNNILYGTCNQGGKNGFGTIFSLNLSKTSPVFALLYNFNNTNGANPNGGLTLDITTVNGTPTVTLYGVTFNGGLSLGNIFSCTTSTAISTITSNTPGVTPGVLTTNEVSSETNNSVDIVVDTTINTVVSTTGVTTVTTSITTSYFYIAYTFPLNQYIESGEANGNLILYNSILYGTTNIGNTIFSFNITTKTFTTLHNLTPNGTGPNSLIISSDGSTLYGTCSQGGLNNCGIIFSYSLNVVNSITVSSFNLLYTFTPVVNGINSDGSIPTGPLVLFGDSLCGLCFGGGSYGSGTLFSFPLSVSPPNITTLYNFNETSVYVLDNSGLFLYKNKLYGAGNVIFSYNLTFSEFYDYIYFITNGDPSSFFQSVSELWTGNTRFLEAVDQTLKLFGITEPIYTIIMNYIKANNTILYDIISNVSQRLYHSKHDWSNIHHLEYDISSAATTFLDIPDVRISSINFNDQSITSSPLSLGLKFIKGYCLINANEKNSISSILSKNSLVSLTGGVVYPLNMINKIPLFGKNSNFQFSLSTNVFTSIFTAYNFMEVGSELLNSDFNKKFGFIDNFDPTIGDYIHDSFYLTNDQALIALKFDTLIVFLISLIVQIGNKSNINLDNKFYLLLYYAIYHAVSSDFSINVNIIHSIISFNILSSDFIPIIDKLTSVISKTDDVVNLTILSSAPFSLNSTDFMSDFTKVYSVHDYCDVKNRMITCFKYKHTLLQQLG